ncbi:MAG: citrate:proton symporter [Pseudomonas sp.]|jgi:CitMHS family citrate-Mg2+:H+ or citrate-Ca2+:H+ symporter|uniref:CitMHS family transporter n=1 Tax=Pseudomonas sp. TaxID=306 RepID=UPI00238F33C1|nr:citrate:proton symporter [Pseudomonas sp.]MDE1198662.1 citrate:proton symporter [Pseudomonas sp.]
MLMLLSFLMLACFIYFLMSKRLSALTALILIPTAFALIGGFQADLGKYVIDGLKMVAPNGVLMIFAMLYFLTMTEAGMFDPLVSKIVKAVRGDPVKIFVGTVLLAFIVALDGDGATIYMIVLSAFLPIYKRLGLSLPMVCCLLLQVAGLGNMVPWGGPTARAATAMHVDVGQMFVPMLPAMIACVIWTFVLAWLFGRRERARLGGTIDLNGDFAEHKEHRGDGWRFYFNWLLTGLLILGLCLELFPLSYMFMVAACLALVVNFPSLKDQQEQLALHAPPILAVSSLIFAAGVFTGVLSGTGMANAVATGLLQVIPASFGPYMAVITALLSIPVTWLVSNDVFYFGILPILAETAQHHGITAVEMARASLIGQPVHILSPLVASTYLVVSMLKLDYAENQRFTMKWSVINCFILLAVSLLTGIFPLFVR